MMAPMNDEMLSVIPVAPARQLPTRQASAAIASRRGREVNRTPHHDQRHHHQPGAIHKRKLMERKLLLLVERQVR